MLTGETLSLTIVETFCLWSPLVPRKAKDVTDAELSVLKVLWQNPNTTIREITDKLYPRQTDSDYATVKKLLARLERKQFVRRHRVAMAHTFEAVLTLDDLVGRRLESLADNLCEGSSVPLLMHLIDSDEISTAQQRQLRKLVKDLADKPKGKKKRK